eukprot:Gregarina_sp_Poly_1__3026@NODE_184_length_11778_cov_104_566988_g164_i0_p3_GENE_NODE_184_length_11778_cov_104_566988_g164_i0NODE_184_length_11778_cov_104_566988_g164_i0_p3_ORF_typecomplete_len368_score43_82BTB/PF00651_31/3_4e05BTB/PF00651_31/2_4e02ubiquitin/PF00240_23/0_0019Skp1_POZ/PF03931_15/0_0052Rad60SLD_2/PF13881_6/0_28_NODE_184_length_11778_cov_104_566988_g164_i0928910392
MDTSETDESSTASIQPCVSSRPRRSPKIGQALQTRSVAHELLEYIQNAGGLKSTVIKSKDGATFQVPQVLLCARSKMFELMLKDRDNFVEGSSNVIHLPEDGELVDAFLTAMKYDKISWVETLWDELASPGSTKEGTLLVSSTEYFVPLIHGTKPLEKSPSPVKQQLLGRLLDLLSMAHKYQFVSLVEIIEEGLLNVPPGIWEAPILVLGVLRLAMLIQSRSLEARCKEALQSLRGADLLAWLNPDPIRFWEHTRNCRLCIVGPHRQMIGWLKVSLSDTIFYVKESLSANFQRSITSIQRYYETVAPNKFLLQHQGLSLDSRKTLAECQVKNEDELKIRFLFRRHAKKSSTPSGPLVSDRLPSASNY